MIKKSDNFEKAILGMNANGYRKTKSGKYEAFISNHSKNVYLGTYDTEEEAKEAVIKYRINRFCSGCKNLGINPMDGVVWESNYVVFPSGDILNLHGEKMIGNIDRNGYVNVIINGKKKSAHRIVAKAFIPNPNNYEQVNHIDGNKQNNSVENLEWCTRSQNLIHAYETGLEKKATREKHHAHKLTNEAVNFIRTHYKKGDRRYGAAALARKYKVDRSTVSDVINQKTWRD